MLVLARKIDQSIMIGENIKITILSIDGKIVRIGIDAPKEIKITRPEFKEKD